MYVSETLYKKKNILIRESTKKNGSKSSYLGSLQQQQQKTTKSCILNSSCKLTSFASLIQQNHLSHQNNNLENKEREICTA
jgi:hypothetical protein